MEIVFFQSPARVGNSVVWKDGGNKIECALVKLNYVEIEFFQSPARVGNSVAWMEGRWKQIAMIRDLRLIWKLSGEDDRPSYGNYFVLGSERI